MYIESGDMLIRNAVSGDAEQLCKWWNDGEIMAHAGFPLGIGTTTDKIRETLSCDDDHNRRCIIEIGGNAVGEMNYRAKGDRCAEIGIKICRSEYRDRGYGTALLRLFIESLLRDYGFARIILDTNLKNERAQHVYRKLGFTELRREYNSWINQLGEFQSTVYYELLL